MSRHNFLGLRLVVFSSTVLATTLWSCSNMYQIQLYLHYVMTSYIDGFTVVIIVIAIVKS